MYSYEVGDQIRRDPTSVVQSYGNSVRDEKRIADTSQLMLDGFSETAGLSGQSRHLLGRFANDFQSIIAETDSGLRDIHPSLPQACLVSNKYWEPETAAMVSAIVQAGKNQSTPRDIDIELIHLRNRRLEGMMQLADSTFLPVLQQQHIAQGVLATPRFYYEGDFGSDNQVWDDSQRGCANACFRMVCAEIIDKEISSASVSESCKAIFGTALIKNFQYLNFFHSPTFRAYSSKAIATVDIIGADFDTIASIATKARQRNPGYQTFCILPIASSAYAGGALHQVVLTEVEGDDVIVHDPVVNGGRKNRRIPKQVFAQRWATAYNEALLVIAG